MISEDPAVFLRDWGEEGVLDGQAVTVIYVAPYAVDPLGKSGPSTSRPRALLPACHVPASVFDAEDVLLELPELPGRTPSRYLVREAQPDGTGWVSLLLTAA